MISVVESKLQRTLGLGDGVVLAIGSIAGSGILFLPSLTYSLAGHEVLIVWGVGTLLCLPMLFVFTDMVRVVPDGSGIEGFVGRGLGPRVAATVPVLFLSVVVLGIPAGALVAGIYLRDAVGGGMWVQLVGALAVLAGAIATNLTGAGAGARLQRGAIWALLAVTVALCVLTYPDARGGYGAVAPAFGALGPILSGVVVAFWAYAGFENLTFIAGEFKNPRRDFPLAMIFAFLAYGGLVVALTTTIAAIVPREQVSEVSGLYQIAEQVGPSWIAVGVITAFALALVQLNSASWLWGMSRLIYASGRAGRMPRWFVQLDGRDLPRRAIGVLATTFVVLTVIGAVVPGLVVGAITLASSVFMFLYLLCLASYWRIERGFGKRLLCGGLAIFLLATLASVGPKILYPISVFIIAMLVSIIRHRRSESR
jgi:amino acid efflux transporter